jgi:hypothetical protein
MSSEHVFENQRSEDGSQRYTAAYLTKDGCLVIETHDLGPVVARTFGLSEYEASETFDHEQTERLRESLGEDLIAAISDRFPTSSLGLTEHAKSIGVGRGRVWNRIGD